MDYRDERDALRGRIENLEDELGHARKELAAQRAPRRRGVLIAGIVFVVVASGTGLGMVPMKRRTAAALSAASVASAAQEVCAMTAECCHNFYMGHAWRDSLPHECAAALDAYRSACAVEAREPGTACQRVAACEARIHCDFGAASREAYCRERLDYYRGRGDSCGLVEPAKAVEAGQVIEPPTGPFTVGPRFPMFARDAAGDPNDPLIWGRSGQRSCLVRFDAQAGRSTWINCSYGPVAAQFNRSAVVMDRILVEFERNLDALDVKTGAQLWTIRLDARIMDLCLGPDGTLRIVLEGGDTYLITLATGKLTPSTRTYDCYALWTDGWWGKREESAPGQHFAHQQREHVPAVDGIVSKGLVAHGARTIVLGYEKPGPHVPMAAAVDAKGKVLWKRELPPEDPSLADTDSPFVATLDDRQLCATYDAKLAFRIGCWDPTTGKTLWDAPLTLIKNGREAEGLVFADRYLFFLHDAHNQHASSMALGVFDLATGAWRYDIQ